jgi:hypothetical protein
VPEVSEESEEVPLHIQTPTLSNKMMMVVRLPTERTAHQILSSLYKAKYSDLSSGRRSDGFSPYGRAPQENGTSSNSNQNGAANIAIASILPMLIAILILAMIVMSVDDVFVRLWLLT